MKGSLYFLYILFLLVILSCSPILQVSSTQSIRATPTPTPSVQIGSSISNYPLELIHPKAGLLAGNHRIYRAYPGLEYNVKVAAIGGAYPYRFSLQNPPVGMTIDSYGTIVWSNPMVSASDVKVTVTDSLEQTVEGIWSISVSTSGFKFVDSVHGNDATGDGTLGNPWNSINKAMSASAPTDILYFRAGSYTNCWVGDGWLSGSKASIWLGYPGETATIDFGSGNRMGITAAVYFDSLTMINAFNQMFYLSSSPDNYVFRRLTLQNISHDGLSSNPAFFRIERNAEGKYFVLQDSVLSHGAQKGMSLYAFNRMLIENNTFTNFGHTMIDLKDGVSQFTVRNNVFTNTNATFSGVPLMGIMAPRGGLPGGTPTYGEVCFNYIRNLYGSALSIPMDTFPTGIAHIYRNTIVGDVRVNSLAPDKGPYYFIKNIIVNDLSSADGDSSDHIYNVTGFGTDIQLIRRDNLVGTFSANIVDVGGNLNSGFIQYLGDRGWQ